MPAIRAGLLKLDKDVKVVVLKADPKAGPEDLVTVVPFIKSKPKSGVRYHEVNTFYGDIWVLVRDVYSTRAANLKNRWSPLDHLKSHQFAPLKAAVDKASE
ncbi:hypothetical protein [Umezawaea tangerina]|uniref:PemK-like, MazF-like toxin of type II toxin-antitoxin system n=1 Tax=Umezawaea tangerina TaxID=84725 RepID=A0A2T0T051_9PSEU|nr:hypothetical protein [Umezawaea tangerina]PRY39019.1 hypothetical protein CLV43_108419 [Umezawaea tangerina]